MIQSRAGKAVLLMLITLCARDAAAACASRRYYEVMIQGQPTNGVELVDRNGGGLGCWLPLKLLPDDATLCATADWQPHVFHIVVTNQCSKKIKAQINVRVPAAPGGIEFKPGRSCKTALKPGRGMQDDLDQGESIEVVCTTKNYGYEPGPDLQAFYDVKVLEVRRGLSMTPAANGTFDPEIVLERAGQNVFHRWFKMLKRLMRTPLSMVYAAGWAGVGVLVGLLLRRAMLAKKLRHSGMDSGPGAVP